MNTRSTSIRIPENTIQKIDALCKKTGACRNKWINSAIQLVFEAGSDYDFGINPDDVEEVKPPKPKISMSYDDGKTWTDWK